MQYIPAILNDRYNLFKELRVAEELLEELEKQGCRTEAECEFIRIQIAEMEKQLKVTQEETLKTISQIRGHIVAHACAMMHFFVGYTWEETGKIFCMTKEAAYIAVKRAFQRNQSSSE